MKSSNFISLDKNDINRNIYHILPLKWLFQIFENRILSFSRPHSWPDSYENIFMMQRIQFVHEKIGIGFYDRFYGQCWSLRKESDALWRLYGDDASGVKISTSILKLSAALKAKEHFSYVGKVRYLKKEALISEVKTFIKAGESNFIGDSQAIGFASTLCIKRLAFRHEEEIRALVFDPGNESSVENRIAIEIDPFDLIESITFGPRLLKRNYRIYRDKLRGLGFSKQIIRSSLYDPPIVRL